MKMVDKKKLRGIIAIIAMIAVGLSGVIGYAIGNNRNTKTTDKVVLKTQNKKIEPDKKTETKKLSVEEIKSFLVAYYTKKDLEENRNRYKPFLTESMYNGVVAQENEPVAQTYKGYVINQKFRDADIYINPDKNTVLVNVNYSYTAVADKSKPKETALGNQPASASLKLTYQYINHKYLINNIELANFSTASTSSDNTGYDVSGQKSPYDSVTNTIQSSTQTSTSQADTSEEK